MSSDIGLGDIRYRVIGEGSGLVFGLGWVQESTVAQLSVLGRQTLRCFTIRSDHIYIVDECHDAHVATAVDAITNAFSKEPM